jgi:cell division protein FtsB
MNIINKFFNFFHQKILYLIGFLIILNIVFGAYYLVVLMEKVKNNEVLNELSKENAQLNADINRVKLEIDKNVDLSNVEKRATNELQMEMIQDVKYLKVNE